MSSSSVASERRTESFVHEPFYRATQKSDPLRGSRPNPPQRCAFGPRRIWGSRPNHPQRCAFGPRRIWGSRPNHPQRWAFGPRRIWGSRPTPAEVRLRRSLNSCDDTDLRGSTGGGDELVRERDEEAALGRARSGRVRRRSRPRDRCRHEERLLRPPRRLLCRVRLWRRAEAPARSEGTSARGAAARSDRRGLRSRRDHPPRRAGEPFQRRRGRRWKAVWGSRPNHPQEAAVPLARLQRADARRVVSARVGSDSSKRHAHSGSSRTGCSSTWSTGAASASSSALATHGSQSYARR